MFDLDGDYLVASYIVVFRLDVRMAFPGFINYLLNSGFYQAKIKGLATRAVSQANINPTTFQGKLLISLPSRAEQEKVAAFFRSVDEIIAAQHRKIDALDAHKKGLMQRLFPVSLDVAV